MERIKQVFTSNESALIFATKRLFRLCEYTKYILCALGDIHLKICKLKHWTSLLWPLLIADAHSYLIISTNGHPTRTS